MHTSYLQAIKKTNHNKDIAERMAQQSQAIAVLAENLSLVPSTHMEAQNYLKLQSQKL